MKVRTADGVEIQIDHQDLPVFRSREWTLGSRGKFAYVKCGAALLHRCIMRPRKGQVVDHRSGDTLDNRRRNLRRATRAQNGSNRIGVAVNNTSGSTGVCWYDKRKELVGWCAYIHQRPKQYMVYRIPTREEAVEVRRAMEVMLFGEFAPANKEAKGTLVGKYESIRELKLACQGPTLSWGKHGERGIYRGSYRDGRNYKVQLTCGGKALRVGRFRTLRGAIAARDEARKWQVRA